MKLNGSISFKIDVKVLGPMLARVAPYLFGLAMIGVFYYTAVAVRQAMNTSPVTPDTSKDAIRFDKQTIGSLKGLHQVTGAVPTTDLGNPDPFGR